jgi:histidinol-phosphatase (PHP family)
MIDYHIHTPLCNHAEGGMEEYVLSAVNKGFSEICFLDHFIPEGPGTKHSMHAGEIPMYMQAISRLREKYSDRITIRAGLEVDYLPGCKGMIEEILGRFDFDAIGGSFHFVDGFNVASRKLMPPENQKDRDNLVRSYFEGLIRMLDWPYFNFFCHPDIVKKTGMVIPYSLSGLVGEFLSGVAEKGLALEFNTSGWDHPAGESYPSESLVKRCFEMSIPFTIGSDSHKPGNVGLHFDKALSILESAGYSELLSFEKRLVRPVPLKCQKCPILS